MDRMDRMWTGHPFDHFVERGPRQVWRHCLETNHPTMEPHADDPMDRQKAEEELRLRVRNLQDMLHATQEAAEAMCDALDGFESRTTGIEATLSPIQGEAESLTSAIRRLQTTIRGGEDFLSKLEVWKAYKDQISAGLVDEGVHSYLEAVYKLQQEENFLNQHQNLACSASARRNTRKLLKEAYGNCLDEFVKVLRRRSAAMDVVEIDLMLQSQGKSLSAIDGTMIKRWAFTGDVGTTLAEIAKCLMAGCKEDLLRRYEEERGSIVWPMWQKLGLENLEDLSTRLVEWSMVSDRVREWITVVRHFSIMGQVEKEVAREIFGNQFCDEVFERMIDRPSQIVSSSAISIINSKKSAEKVFSLLDMLENLENQTPKLQFVLRNDNTSRYLDRFLTLRTKMSKSAREAFYSLEESVLVDNSKHVAEGGTVHPLTSHVVHFVQKISDYRAVLAYIFHQEHASSPGSAAEEDKETRRKICESSMRILSALQSNLESKSSAYKDPALAALFMANNIHYVIKHVEQGDLHKILGRDWVERQEEMTSQFIARYVDCTMVLFSANGRDKAGIVRFRQQKQRDKIKEEFKHFNSTMEEIWGEQRSWNIPDPSFRDRVRRLLLDRLKDAFSAVYDANREEKFSNPSKYIKFDMEQIRDAVNVEFFEGLAPREKKG